VNLAFGDEAESRLLVADFQRGLVRRVTRTGVVTTVVPPRDGFFRPFGITRGADAAIYVQTDGNTDEQIGDATGTLWRLGPSGLGGPRLVLENVGRPRGLVGWGTSIAAADIEAHVVRRLEGESLVDGAGVAGSAGLVHGPARRARPGGAYGQAIGGEGARLSASTGQTPGGRPVPPAPYPRGGSGVHPSG